MVSWDTRDSGNGADEDCISFDKEMKPRPSNMSVLLVAIAGAGADVPG